MLITEPHGQDVLLAASKILRDAMESGPEDASQPAARASVESEFRRQRDAAVLHRNGRLRAIQALHRPSK